MSDSEPVDTSPEVIEELVEALIECQMLILRLDNDPSRKGSKPSPKAIKVLDTASIAIGKAIGEQG